MSAEGNAWPRPVRRRFVHDGGVTHGREAAESGRRLLQAVAHVVKLRIGTSHAVDAPEPAQPMSGLRQRDAHMPRAATFGTVDECRHGRERHQITGGVVERLPRQRLRLAGAEGLRFRGVEAACGLHE